MKQFASVAIWIGIYSRVSIHLFKRVLWAVQLLTGKMYLFTTTINSDQKFLKLIHFAAVNLADLFKIVVKHHCWFKLIRCYIIRSLIYCSKTNDSVLTQHFSYFNSWFMFSSYNVTACILTSTSTSTLTSMMT